jgi:hypothetical protein
MIKNPKDLISTYRFDLIIKYLYSKSIINNYKTSYFKDMYKEHLYKWNGFKEYDNPNKNTFEDYDNEFNNIIESIKNGFDPNISLVPIVDNKYIVNGSHRVAACLSLNKNVNCRESFEISDGQKDCSWISLFSRLDISKSFSDRVALEYAMLKSNTFLVTLFPSANNNYQQPLDILNKIGKVFYYKSINFSKNGPLNLMKQLYLDEEWATAYNGLGYITKRDLCFTTEQPTYVFLVEFNSVQDAIDAKKEIRNIFNIGNHSVHVNDTHDETIRLSQYLFNDEGIHFLNNKESNNQDLDICLNEFKQIISSNNLNIDDYCITGSSILCAYGVRDFNDLDYLHSSKEVRDDKDLIHSHNNYGIGLYHLDYDEIIYNPNNHFYYNGVKFASLDVLKNLKVKRNESKDIIDIDIINKLKN